MRSSKTKWSLVALVTVLVVAVAAFLVLRQSDEAQAGEVLLEAALQVGPDPFTPPIESSQPSQTTLDPPPNVQVNTGGKSIGLYGGTGRLGECDKRQLATFLSTNPEKARAWAGVLGLTQADIVGYVAKLTQARLGVDTRITNHGFVAGTATPRQSVLQTGTAVLTDAAGTPRVRCKCGNPLLPPVVAVKQPTYRGTPWQGFSTAAIAAPPGTTGVKPTASATLATQSPTPAAEPNLLANGGFEQGFGLPWGTGIYEPREDTFWGQADADATVVTDVVHGGTSALRIANRSPVGPQVYRTASQSITVKGSAPHCLMFWAKVDSGTAGVLTVALNDAWTDRAGVQAGTADWTLVAHTFTTEDAKIDVRLISENTGTVWVDDITVTEGACA